MSINSVPHFDSSTFAIGFEELFRRVSDNKLTQTNYPPYNIIKESDTIYGIQIAIAGFGKDDIDVEQDGNVLNIVGEAKTPQVSEYIHKGISNRGFRRTFTLAEYIEVKDVFLENGLLTVTLEKNIPEEKKPKKFSIKA